MTEISTDALLRCPLFKGVEEGSLERMLHCFRTQTAVFPKDGVITSTGETLRYMGVVMSGQAMLTQDQADGRQLDMEILQPGSVFGEVEAFTGQCWHNSVVARQRTSVLFLEPCKVVHTCENACPWHHQLIQNMLECMADRTRSLQRQVYYLTIHTLRGQISALLLEEMERTGAATFMLDMNRNQLAGYLNVARPSLSRELASMQEDGLISYYRQSFRVLDKNGLLASIDM